MVDEAKTDVVVAIMTADFSCTKEKKEEKKKKKKKKKKKYYDKDGKARAAVGCGAKLFGIQVALLAEQDLAQEKQAAVEDIYDNKAEYTYDELLNLAVDLLTHKPTVYDNNEKRNINPPEIQFLTNNKTMWVNFQEICSMMERSPDHVMTFFFAELGTDGNIDGNQRLIIRGKYALKYIESFLRKYLVEYVTCDQSGCRSLDTVLETDSAARLHILTCSECGARRVPAHIRKNGYHTTSDTDRHAARNAKNLLDYCLETNSEMTHEFVEQVSPRVHRDDRDRVVSFLNCEIRTYTQILGDHPCCLEGCPIQLGWDYQEETDVVDIDEYEKTHPTSCRTKNQSSTRLRLSSEERKNILCKQLPTKLLA